MKSKILLVAYFLVGLLNVLAHFFESPELVQYSKPTLMPLLLAYVYEHAKGQVTVYIIILSLGIILSWAGDVMLMFPGDGLFLGGLSFFLLALATYSYLFQKTIGGFKPNFLHIGIVLFLDVLLLFYLVPAAGALGMPLVVYSLFLSSIVVLAMARKEYVSADSYRHVLAGAALFMLSDAVLAWSRFVEEIPCHPCIVMGTYVLAQYLIAKGILLQNANYSA